MVSEDTSCRIHSMFLEEKRNRATGGRVDTYHQRSNAELAYQKVAEHLLTDENCFKAMLVSSIL